MQTPVWDDLKVAFSIANEESFEAWAGHDWKCGNRLPSGWSLNETDGSGARIVAIFRVEGPFREQDAEQVARLLAPFQSS